MPFYEQLGDKYDVMIRWKQRLEREAPFFQRLFSENRIKRVLDLGCGTGQHSAMFNKWGSTVVGVDPSPALLAKAKELITDPEDKTLVFHESDLVHFHEFAGDNFDIVVCLGNTLPHLRSENELADSFRSIFDALRPGGVFVFQNRNYDRLLKTRERFLLPTTHRQADSEQIFFRFNDFEDDGVRFNVVHFTRVGDGWIHEVYSTMLSPWRQGTIDNLLHEVGFHSADFYGDFSGSPFDTETSTDLIGLVRKSPNR